MRSVLSTVEMDHAIDTSEGCASTLVAVRVKFLFCKDIAACLPESIMMN